MNKLLKRHELVHSHQMQLTPPFDPGSVTVLVAVGLNATWDGSVHLIPLQSAPTSVKELPIKSVS